MNYQTYLKLYITAQYFGINRCIGTYLPVMPLSEVKFDCVFIVSTHKLDHVSASVEPKLVLFAEFHYLHNFFYIRMNITDII